MFEHLYLIAWPSGLRRWFKAPVSSEAWVRIPPLSSFYFNLSLQDHCAEFVLHVQVNEMIYDARI